MPLGLVLEYGTNRAGDFTSLVGDVDQDFSSLAQNSEGQVDYALLGSFGTTDLIAVAQATTTFTSTQLPNSAVQRGRRAMATLAPDADDLSSWMTTAQRGGTTSALGFHGRTKTLDHIVGRKPSFKYAWAFVIRTRLSPLVSLVCPRSRLGLRRMLTVRLFSRTGSFWRRLERFEDEHIGNLAELRSADVELAPLMGLDEIDLAIVGSACRLESVAGVVEAINQLRAEELLPVNDRVLAGLHQLFPSLSAPMLRERWNHAKLFTGARTTVALPIRNPAADSPRGLFEREGDDPDEVLCGSASLRTAVAAPESFGTGTGQDEETNHADEELVFFGEYSFRSGPADGARLRLTRGLLLDRMAAQFGPKQGKRRTVTHVGQWIRRPKEPQRAPSTELHVRLDRRLEGARRHHLRHKSRALTEGGVVPSYGDTRRPTLPWLAVWRQGTRRAGIPYPLTDGGETMLARHLDRLTERPETFANIIDAVELLPRRAEDYLRGDRTASPRDLALWLEAMLAAEAQRWPGDSHMLDLRPSLALHQTGVGVGTARDAFEAFVLGLAHRLGIRDPVLVVDGASRKPQVRAPSTGGFVVEVASLVLGTPMHWGVIYGHEIAHAAMLRLPRRPQRRAEETQPGAQRIHRAWARLAHHCNGDPGPATLAEDLLAAGRLFWAQRPHPRLNAGAWARALVEVPADVLAFANLAPTDSGADPTEHRRWFWFLAGPAFAHAQAYVIGPPADRDRSWGVGRARLNRATNHHVHFLIRMALLDRLIEPAWEDDISVEDWLRALYTVLQDLAGSPDRSAQMRRPPDRCRPGMTGLRRRLGALLEDMGLSTDLPPELVVEDPEISDRTRLLLRRRALRGATMLVASVSGHRGIDPSRPVSPVGSPTELLKDWLELMTALRDHGPELFRTELSRGIRPDSDESARAAHAMKAYRHYVGMYRKKFGPGEDERPWPRTHPRPRAVRGHRLSLFGHRGGVFHRYTTGGTAAWQSYEARIQRLLFELADVQRERRFARLRAFLKRAGGG